MKSNLLILLLFILSVANTLPLKDTKVNMTWEQFHALSQQKVDTVMVQPETRPPVEILPEKCNISIFLDDSTGSGTMVLSYIVLSETPWIPMKLFDSNGLVFNDISTSGDDIVQSTDSGYVLIAKGSKSKSTRKLTLKWSASSTFQQGLRNFSFSLPKVGSGTLKITAPVDFTSLSCNEAVLQNDVKEGNSSIYHFSLPTTRYSTIRYTPPVRVVNERDTATIDTVPVVKETQITSWHEGINFISEERVLSVNMLKLNVNHSPITQFSATLPQNFDVLNVQGNGIEHWNVTDSSTLNIDLTFELSGDYSVIITGEYPIDSLQIFTPFNVENAMREKGIIAIALEGAGEAGFVSLENGSPLPRNTFIRKMSSSLLNSCRQYRKNRDDIILAAEFSTSYFSGTVSTRKHEPATVVNALVDSGVIITAITKEYNSLTTATYSVRQRNRQFITLNLPDSCDIWSVSINGISTTPFVDKSGSVKVPLQRFASDDNSATPLNISFTYFMRIAENMKEVSLRAPIPDVPVNSLSWSLFYPEDWVVKNSGGDFQTTLRAGMRKHFISLSESDRDYQFNELQNQTLQRKSVQPKGNLPQIGISPNHLVGKRILIVGKPPVLTVNFIPRSTYLAIRIGIWTSLIVVLALSIILLIKKRKTHYRA